MGYTSRQSRHFLFVLWDGGGNVPPQLALARRLTERGHRVRVLAPRVLRSRIEAAGGMFVPLRRVPEHDGSSPASDLAKDFEARTVMSAAARNRDHVIFGTVSAYNRDVAAAIADERPNVVVTDYMLLGAYVEAERAGIPLVGLIHMIYPLPARGLPPFGMGFQPANGPLGWARDAVFAQVFRSFYNAGLGTLNQIRAESGLPPLTSALEQFEHATRLLVTTSPSFDFPATALPSNVRYVGPQLEDPAWFEPWTPPQAIDDRPLVLVSLSTTYQRQGDLVRRIIAALADLPVQGLVTLGPALQAADFSLPPNVQAAPYIPHVLVCPHADLVITHGGHGTVITALSSGVPLVCLPMGRDQADNAARVVWRGAGLRRSSHASVADLRRAMRSVLEEPRFRASARRIADGIASEGDPNMAIAELEALAPSPIGVAG